jgi:hypothetical protein
MKPLRIVTDYILTRLREPSTWRGIFMVLTSFGIYLQPDQTAAITAFGLSLVGLINIFRKEQVVKLLVVFMCLPMLVSCENGKFIGLDFSQWKEVTFEAGKELGKQLPRVTVEAYNKVQRKKFDKQPVFVNP